MVERESAEHVKSFTAVLGVFGGLCLGSAAMLSFVKGSYSVLMAVLPGEAYNPWILATIWAFLIVLAVMCIWAAALRSVEARVAGAATCATSFLLGIFFPLGTATFLWWWISVRKREAGLATAAGASSM